MCINDLYHVAICRSGLTAYSDVICFSKRICASTVEASESVFRHTSRVCGRASSVRIEVFRTASSVCKVVNKVPTTMSSKIVNFDNFFSEFPWLCMSALSQTFTIVEGYKKHSLTILYVSVMYSNNPL